MPLPALLASTMFALLTTLGGLMFRLAGEPATDWHITVYDQAARTAVGDRPTYRITAHDTAQAQVTARVARPGPPQDVRAASASVVGRDVAWRSDTRPGSQAAFAVSATVTQPSEAGDDPYWWAWAGSIFFGLFAVVSAVWLHRKTNPDLLSPQNAHHGFEPGQPGGAPSA
jgi:hypothetical protein